MSLYTLGGELLVDGGALAINADCCCGYASCSECLDGLGTVELTLSGYVDVELDFGPTYSYYLLSNLNSSYTLADTGGSVFCIELGTPCTLGDPHDEADRGILVYINQGISGLGVSQERRTYVWKICARLLCDVSGGMHASISFFLQTIRVIVVYEPANECVAGPAGVCHGICLVVPEPEIDEWEGFCNGSGSMTGDSIDCCIYFDYTATGTISAN